MPEYGIFTDEGCITSQLSSLEAGQKLMAEMIASGEIDPDADTGLKVSEICPDHEEQTAAYCEECFAADAEIEELEDES